MLPQPFVRIFKATLTALETLFPSLKARNLFRCIMDADDVTAQATMLRVDKLTLFSHGMACVHHKASINHDATLTLSLPPQHMNDVLKTLSILDHTGVIHSVTYDAPTSHDNFPTYDALNALIGESRGARVHIIHDRTSIRGRLIGMHTFPRDQQGDQAVVVLQENGAVVTTKLSSMASLTFLDPSLQALLTKRLEQSALRAHARNNRLITITTRGEGQRILSASYAIESPVYKLTYRFLLRPDSVVLQAWAIVDNPSDEDLEDIQVVIVSGLPLSFRHDLYNARFITRPLQQVTTHAGVGPPSAMKHRRVRRMLGQAKGGPLPHENLMHSRQADGAYLMPSSTAEQEDVFAEGAFPPAPPVEIPMPSAQTQQDPTPRWTPAAEASAAGSVHEYRVRERVTIRARESALLPLIMTTCKGGAVDLYSYDIRPTNTLRAVTVRNDTPAPFETGPVSVYDDDRLVGEGMLHACRPGKEECVPYCVNLDCVVQRDVSEASGGVVECLAVAGSFMVKRSVENVTTYEISARRDGVDVVIVHKVASGYDPPCALVLPAGKAVSLEEGESLNAISIEDGLARYRIKIEAGGSTRVRVTEQRVESVHREIRGSCTSENIGYLLREGMVGQTAAEKMRDVMDTQGALNRVQGEIVMLEKSVKDAENSQARYRENVVALGGGHGRGRHSGLVSEYFDRIRESESRIEELRQEIERKRAEKRELVEKIEVMIADFDKKSALV